MYQMFLAQAGCTPEAGGQSGGGGYQMLFLMGAFFLIMYFLIIRPKQKEQRKHQDMLSSLRKGDQIVTTGGIHGRIERMKEKEGVLTLKIADNVKIDVARSAVAGLVKKGDEEEE